MWPPFEITVRIEETSPGEFFYRININGKLLICGERATRNGAKRAVRAQLKQLKQDIERQLKSL